MIISAFLRYPHCAQRKKKIAKKKEIAATTGFIWVRFIHEALIHLG